MRCLVDLDSELVEPSKILSSSKYYVGTFFKEQSEKMAIVPQAKPTLLY